MHRERCVATERQRKADLKTMDKAFIQQLMYEIRLKMLLPEGALALSTIAPI